MVRLKRAYDPAAPADGHRYFVERLWPRGLRKEQAHFDEWLKDVAPSDALRKWFHYDPNRWAEFEQKYARELTSGAARRAFDELVGHAASETVTLIYSAHDTEHNNAVVLKRMIEQRLQRPPREATWPTEQLARPRSRMRARREHLVDEEIRESFPASDPPTWSSLHAGDPSREPATASSPAAIAARHSPPGGRGRRSPSGSRR